TQALKGTKYNKSNDIPRTCRSGRTRKKNDCSDDENWFSSVLVGKLSVNGNTYGLRQNINRKNPCKQRKAAQVSHNLRYGGGYDSRIHRSKHHGCHQRCKNPPLRAFRLFIHSDSYTIRPVVVLCLTFLPTICPILPLISQVGVMP